MLTIDEKIALVKRAPRPENIYYFFLCTRVDEIPARELSRLFDWVYGSLSFFEKFKDSDAHSRDAEGILKQALKELYVRLEIEHVPDVREPIVLMVHEQPRWEGLDALWHLSDHFQDDTVSEFSPGSLQEEQGFGPTSLGTRQVDASTGEHRRATHLILLSHLAKEAGHLFTAEQRLRKVISLLADASNETALTLRAKALHLLANTLLEVQSFAEAEQYCLAAKAIYEKLDRAKEISFVLHSLGNLYSYTEQLDQAISYFQESLAIKERVNTGNEDTLPTLYGLAICYIKTDQLDRALQVIRMYEAKAGSERDTRLDELWVHFLANQGDWTGLIEKLESFLSQPEENRSPRDHLMLEINLARAYNQLGEYKTAEQHFWRALFSIEEAMSKWLSPSMREGLRTALLPGIELQFQVWRTRAESGEATNMEILKVAERLSAIDLRAKFGNKQIALDIDASTLRMLSDGELLVYLFGTDQALYTFFLDKDGILLADSTPYDEYSQFDSLPTLDYFLESSDEPSEHFQTWVNTVVVTVLLLFLVNKEVRKICLLFPFGKGNNIPWDFFIGNAHRFSNQPRPPRFKTTPVSRLPSFSVFQTLKNYQVGKGVGPPAVFVDPVGRFTPLQETVEEAKMIEDVLPEAMIFAGPNANADHLLQVVRPAFLHISCHGAFDRLQPLESSLLLSAKGLSAEEEFAWRQWQKGLLAFLKQDPRANVQEYGQPEPSLYQGAFKASFFQRLRLKGTEFVFLSACSVARVSDYDEIEGFAQSVFLAGCPNLIAPLWPVNVEATLIFVKEFYAEYRNLTDLGVLQAGKIGKCVALARQALLKVYSHREAAAWTVFGLG